MTKDRYVLWTDINLNFDDWKDDFPVEINSFIVKIIGVNFVHLFY